MRLIFGKGINDADYSVSETVQRDGKTVHVWCCPYYRLWKNMFQRCYSEEKNKAYSNSVVDEAWFLFSDFSLWVKSQPQHAWWIEDPRSFELDKDLLGDGCKMYSPKVCVFVPKVLNNFFLLSDGSRGNSLWVLALTGRGVSILPILAWTTGRSFWADMLTRSPPTKPGR